MEALRQAQRSNPSGHWWMKADACDVRKGLRESMRGEWSGDEDLGSGKLNEMYKEYQSRCTAVKNFGKHLTTIMNDCKTLMEQLTDDVYFLVVGISTAKEMYEKAFEAKRYSESVLMELSWDLVGYEELEKQAMEFKKITMAYEVNKETVLKIAGSLRMELLLYLKGIYSKKRTSASHLLIFMIADEIRARKPYAVPVRFLSYKSITDAKLRELEVEVENAMKTLGMIVVGMCK